MTLRCRPRTNSLSLREIWIRSGEIEALWRVVQDLRIQSREVLPNGSLTAKEGRYEKV